MLSSTKSIFIIAISCYFIVAVLSLTDEEMNKKKIQVVNDCADKDKSLTKEEQDNIVNKRLEPTTKAGFCFVACIYKNLEFFAPNNTVLVENMKKEITRLNPKGGDEYDRKIKVVEECKKKEVTPIPADPCDAATIIKKCLVAEKLNHNVTTRLW